MDTKKVYLDEFVRSFKGEPAAKVEPIIRKVKGILNLMEQTFIDKDPLLKSSGMVVLYFALFMQGTKGGWIKKVKRSSLDRFEAARAVNRAKAEKDLTKANYELLEFDRYTQSPNDAYAIRVRLRTLKRFLRVQRTDVQEE